MADVIGVRFKPGGKLYYFAPNDQYILQGSMVIVETARGLECGEVVMERRTVPDEELTHELKNVVREATAEDILRVEENRKKEVEAYNICLEKIAKHGLEMNLVGVEYAFDGSKILFNFTADGRVDFRELVKDLASVFRTRIELRQIGVRDEAKLLGGFGICGRPFCCTSFMGDFAPVSIKMAKEQGLSLNPVKISGTCGRLMCCLKYEEEAYRDLIKRTPRVGALVKTPDGNGTVVEVNLIAGTLKVRIGDDPEIVPKSFKRCQVRQIGKSSQAVDEDAFEDELFPEDEEEAAALAKLLEDEQSPEPEHSSSSKRGGNRDGHSGKGRKHQGKAEQPHESGADVGNYAGNDDSSSEQKNAQAGRGHSGSKNRSSHKGGNRRNGHSADKAAQERRSENNSGNNQGKEERGENAPPAERAKKPVEKRQGSANSAAAQGAEQGDAQKSGGQKTGSSNHKRRYYNRNRRSKPSEPKSDG